MSSTITFQLTHLQILDTLSSLCPFGYAKKDNGPASYTGVCLSYDAQSEKFTFMNTDGIAIARVQIDTAHNDKSLSKPETSFRALVSTDLWLTGVRSLENYLNATYGKKTVKIFQTLFVDMSVDEKAVHMVYKLENEVVWSHRVPVHSFVSGEFNPQARDTTPYGAYEQFFRDISNDIAVTMNINHLEKILDAAKSASTLKYPSITFFVPTQYDDENGVLGANSAPIFMVDGQLPEYGSISAKPTASQWLVMRKRGTDVERAQSYDWLNKSKGDAFDELDTGESTEDFDF
jgi:hypothetical protein